MMKDLKAPPLAIIVTGATCGGKSRRAMEISQFTGLPVKVMDSMKVYRGMDIGSAKPAAELRQGNPYQLTDLVDPWEEFTVFDWLEALRESTGDGQPWLICGGTVFYLHALREGIFQGPGPSDEIRSRLKDEARAAGGDFLHDRLQEIDPEAAQTIHRHDHKRLMRAIEVYEQSGEPISVLAPSSHSHLGSRQDPIDRGAPRAPRDSSKDQGQGGSNVCRGVDQRG